MVALSSSLGFMVGHHGFMRRGAVARRVVTLGMVGGADGRSRSSPHDSVAASFQISPPPAPALATGGPGKRASPRKHPTTCLGFGMRRSRQGRVGCQAPPVAGPDRWWDGSALLRASATIHHMRPAPTIGAQRQPTTSAGTTIEWTSSRPGSSMESRVYPPPGYRTSTCLG